MWSYKKKINKRERKKKKRRKKEEKKRGKKEFVRVMNVKQRNNLNLN
jgi:hypothetical protein